MPVIGGGMKRGDKGGHHQGGKRPRRDFNPKGPQSQQRMYQQTQHQSHGQHQQMNHQMQSNGYGRSK